METFLTLGHSSNGELSSHWHVEQCMLFTCKHQNMSQNVQVECSSVQGIIVLRSALEYFTHMVTFRGEEPTI
jgi:hypothetical protein